MAMANTDTGKFQGLRVEGDDENYRPSRQMLNENQSACDFFLKSVTSSHQLKIGSSLIEGAGNGVFVMQDVAAGQEIYRSKPLITCVDATNPTLCHNCLHDSSSMLLTAGRFRMENDKVPTSKPCSGCKVTRFCSKGKAIDVLQTNFNNYAESDRFNAIRALATEAKEKTGSKMSSGTLWSLICGMMTNCVIIRPSAQRRSLGVSLDLVTSLINHACNANVFVFFEGNELRARSLRPIRAGEELTRCYSDPTMDVLLRQHILKTEQFFDCQCIKCQTQLKAHKKLLGKGDTKVKFAALLKAEQEILDLVQSANIAVNHPGLNKDFENLDTVESKMRFICSEAFPTSAWPDSLEPLPSARMALGVLRVNNYDLLDALQLMLRGCMLGGRDKEVCAADWVNEMVDLVRVLMVLGNAPPTSDLFVEDKALPGRDEVRLLVNGYLYEISKVAVRVFGSDAKYTAAILDWLARVLNGTPGTPRPGTPEFELRFRLFQAKLLVWGGVDKYKGMMLSA